jgi:hypothetical protein
MASLDSLYGEFCQNCGQPAPVPAPAYPPSLVDAEQTEPAEPAVAEVLDHIAWVLRGRATPLTSLEVRRLHPPGGETVKDYLELRSTIFYGYVACFPYGTDLYVGWAFWVRLSPFWYLCMVIMRIWQSLTNRGNDLYTSLRFDTARALREVMHSAAREGTDVAVGERQGQGRGIVGTAIRVTESAG